MSNLDDLKRKLERAAVDVPQKALTIMGVEAKNFVQKNFDEQGFTDSTTEKWEERKTTDNKGRDLTRYRTNRVGKAGDLTRFGQKEKGRALLTGHASGGNKLRNSFKTQINLSAKEVALYTDKAYAERHNEGLDGMPKRAFIGKSEYLKEQIEKKITKELDKIFRQ